MYPIKNILSFTVVAGCVTYIILIVMGKFVDAQIEHDINTVIVRDRLAVGVHNLSGMVMMPSSCHDVSATASKIDLSNYLITFKGWKNPSRECIEEETPQWFHLTVFAPSTGVAFQAVLDERPIPLTVVPTIE